MAEMFEDADTLAVFQARAKKLQDWLELEGAVVAHHRHLDHGSPERAYWHAGYHQALRELLPVIAGLSSGNEHTANASQRAARDAENSHAA